MTLSGNTITGIDNANETDWDGILAASLSDAAGIISNNMIDGSGVSAPTQGIEVWNVNPASPVSISGGSVSNVGIGVYVNNYEGYNSNGGNTAAIIDGINLTNNLGLGIYVKDSPSNTNGATVFAEIKGNTEINTNPNGTAILIEGSDASANIHDNLSTITGNEIGVLVDNGNATITNNTISANGTGILFQNDGTGEAHHNNIIGNTTIGVSNTTTAFIDATENWWGSANGPSTVGFGSGDKVSTLVTYCPWLDNVVGSGINTYTIHNDVIAIDVTVGSSTTTLSSTGATTITNIICSNAEFKIANTANTTTGSYLKVEITDADNLIGGSATSYVLASEFTIPNVTLINTGAANKMFTVVLTPYTESDGDNGLDISDECFGTADTISIAVQPKPSISNVVTSTNGYNQTMTSGGSYNHTTCSNEEVTTSIPSFDPDPSDSMWYLEDTNGIHFHITEYTISDS